MVYGNTLNCCGWQEVSNLRTYDNLKNAIQNLTNARTIRDGRARCGALLFTQAGVRAKYGVKFAKDLQDAKLGEVIVLPKFKNPNTGKIITTYVWFPDNEALRQYCNTEKISTPFYY